MSHLPLWYLTTMTPDACDDLIIQAQKFPCKEATIGEDGVDKNTRTRDTKVRFAEEGFWLETAMKFVAEQGNSECKWDYEVTGAERIQFAEYGPGQHYDWHTDTFPLSGSQTDRKITVVCLLNDPSEFEGGAFELRLYNTYLAPLQKGTMIAFPSILEHRVTPVLSGVRHTATMWFNGPRFR